MKINGADPDFHRRDLWNAIQAGAFPEWELGVQLFDEEFAEKFEFDVLDPTKLIPEELIPVRRIGRLVLDRMPDNFFAETEQVAFMTQNVPPGIDFSNDPLLQGRNFSYLDTQIKRLGGPNFTHIPINAPKCPFAHFQQDGHMAMRNPVGRVNYEPNSWGDAAGPRESPERGFRSYPEELSGSQVRARSETFADHYSQARQFFLSQTPNEQKHLKDALVFELSKVEREDIRSRLVSHLLNIYEPLANGVAAGLGLDLPAPAKAARETMEDLPISPALSIAENGPDRFEGRKLGILISDGAEADLVMALIEAAHDVGGDVEIIAPRIGGAVLSDGSTLIANQKIDGGPSVLYDAVAIILSEDGAETFSADSAARDFASDAFAHCKFIGYSAEALALFESIGLGDKLDDGCIVLSDPVDSGAFLDACADLRFWEREAGVDLDPHVPD